MDFEDRVEELFLDIPEAGPEEGVPHISKTGKLVFVSGQLPLSEGRLAYKGRLGLELSADAGASAARAALIRALGVLRQELKSLDKIKKIVHTKLYIASGFEFCEHRKVLNSVLGMLKDIFGPSGKCSAEVVGCVSLPEGAAVELSMIIEVK